MENTSVHSLADEISPLTLAFVGDGVYDLLVREYLVRNLLALSHPGQPCYIIFGT